MIPELAELTREDRRATWFLALDPGETTGWSFWCGSTLMVGDQTRLTVGDLDSAFDSFPEITTVVLEDYRVYLSKAATHVNSHLFTARLIGAIEHVASQRGLVVYEQMASEAKTLIGDDKLERWGLLHEAAVHMQDSVRHACYWLIANRKPPTLDFRQERPNAELRNREASRFLPQ